MSEVLILRVELGLRVVPAFYFLGNAVIHPVSHVLKTA